MSTAAYHPERAKVGYVDPGGTRARPLQGNRLTRRRDFNIPTRGVYRHDMESGTMGVGVAAENAKNSKELGLKDTQTITTR